VQQHSGVLTTHDHGVGFYDDDPALVDVVAQFVAAGRAGGQPALVLMTPAQRAALEVELVRLGLDPVAEQAGGGLVLVDAEETLATLLVDGAIDPARFEALTRALLVPMMRGGRPARAFGEMVGVLWEQGNVAAALELEELWTGLTHAHPLAVLCGYPSDSLERARLGDVTAICERHTGLVPTRQRTQDDMHQQDRLFPPGAHAIADVRSFVREVLEAWHLDEVVADATLVVSEIATNAVKHAGSAFVARVSRSEDGVLISVEDADHVHPERKDADPEDLSGRGLAIVEALSRRWGADAGPDGKVVWSELAISSD
jgi:anti-sigma regulatory factor (Ser/Thr protein kinase)